MPKQKMFVPGKNIKSFDEVKRETAPYQSLVNGLKPIGNGILSWVESKQVKLSGKILKLGCAFYSEENKTVYCLLNYNSQKFYLTKDEQSQVEQQELLNANKALKLCHSATLQFVPLGMGHEGLMLTLTSEHILKQLIEQLGPISDDLYESEYCVEQQAINP